MILTTHALVGAAAARIFSFHPVAAFCAAFLSHFFIDAIPHWDYSLGSMNEPEDRMNYDMVIGPAFYNDILKIGFDGVLGVGLSFLLFHPATEYQMLITFLGVAGGILPDPLQFVYFKFRHEPFIILERFHIWIHADIRLTNRFFGISFQSALVFLCLLVSGQFLW